MICRSYFVSRISCSGYKTQSQSNPSDFSLLSPVFCLLSPVFCLLYSVSCRKKRKHRATFSHPMFSGGEKNTFFYRLSYRQTLTPTLIAKNLHFTPSLLPPFTPHRTPNHDPLTTSHVAHPATTPRRNSRTTSIEYPASSIPISANQASSARVLCCAGGRS